MSNPFAVDHMIVPLGRGRVSASFPTCAKCKKPVDRFTYGDDPLSMGVYFIAECHGASERVDVSAFSLVDADGIAFGECFVSSPALPPKP